MMHGPTNIKHINIIPLSAHRSSTQSPSDFRTKSSISFFPMRANSRTHLIVVTFIILIIFGEKWKKIVIL